MTLEAGQFFIDRQKGQIVNRSEDTPSSDRFLEGETWTPDQQEDTGIVVACVHGMWGRYKQFRALGEAMSDRGHTTVALGLRGHGNRESNTPIRQWRIDQYRSDVRTHLDGLMSRVNGEQVVVAGHSMAWPILCPLLKEYKDSIAGAVLFAPATGPGARQVTQRSAIKRPMVFLKALLPGKSRLLIQTEQQVQEAFFGPNANPDHVREVIEKTGQESIGAYTQLLLSEFRTLKHPGKLNMPILVFHGDTDPTTKRAYQEELDNTLSNGNKLLSIVMRAGHYPFIELPVEIANLTNKWLKGLAKRQ